MGTLDDAFVAHLAEAEEQRRRFLLSSSERTPTKGEIELILAQTDLKFKLLRQDTLEYAKRMEAALQARILEMEWGMKQ